MATSPRVEILDVKAFHAACKRRGAISEQQIANLLGVNRTTIYRATRKGQTVGTVLRPALVATFGADEAAKLTKFVKQSTARAA